MIKTVKKSLFDAPKGSVLVHACNAKGVWSAGIAKQFAERFPQTHRKYKDECLNIWITGRAFIYPENGYYICNLITSEGFGANVDKPEVILKNTGSALEDLKLTLQVTLNKPVICSNKFNSGLFNVPWKDTEALIHEILPEADWTVYDI